MRVLKFGGKSLENSEKFENICNYIKTIYEQEKKIIVVVSALGNTTDNLENLSKEFVGEKTFESEMATLLSTGEIQSSLLFTMKLKSLGVPAKCYYGKDIGIITSGRFTSSRIELIDKSPLLKCLENNVVAVVAGFQGINKNGEITTLGRGGSDTTAVALAAAFNVDAEIYSDFDGVFAGDPRKDNFIKLNMVGYGEMLKMSKAGAKVLDSRATELAKNFNVKIISKSSSLLTLPGSIISHVEQDTLSICEIENLCKVSIIFSNSNKLQKISRIVLNTIKSEKFYNLSINSQEIEFFVSEKISKKIIHNLARQLKILNYT